MHTAQQRERSTAMQTPAAWRRFHWVGLCLSLLVVACSSAPAPPSLTPIASVPVQVATITTYHGHTSTIFAVAFSPDGRRIASGSNDSTVQMAEMFGRVGRSFLPIYHGQTFLPI